MNKIMTALITMYLAFFSGIAFSWAGEMSFQWFGQACFSIVLPSGATIVTDPVDFSSRNIPYAVAKEIQPDIVTVSHEHYDHNAVNAVSGNPVIVRGLASGGKEFARVSEKIKDVGITTVPSYHDKAEGKQRGLNAIFIFEWDHLRIAHLGDLGHMLDDKQIEDMGKIDILLIPVGGGPTIGPKEADQLIARLNPKMIVIPMHFKTDVVTFMPYSAEDFINGKLHSKRILGNRYVLDMDQLPRQLEYVVLNYK